MRNAHENTNTVARPSLLKYLLSLLLLWFAAGWLMNKTCCEAGEDSAMAALPVEQEVDMHDLPVDEETHGQTMAVVDDVEAIKLAKLRVNSVVNGMAVPELVDSKTFRFKSDDYSLAEPMSDALKQNMASVKGVLSSNPSNRLTLTGRYRGDEKNPSAFPTLGLARANHVKSLLVKEGFDTQQIELADSLDNYAVADVMNVYDDRVSLELGRQSAAEIVNQQKELSNVGAQIRANPLVLYFNTGESSISLSETQRQTILNIVRFLDKNPNAKAHVIGHTDGVGSAATNKKLGKDRAAFAAMYLQSNGLASERIVQSSKGESEPIATNATKEGQAKNRRTVVTLF